MYLYHYDKYCLSYPVSDCYAGLTGFSVLENTFAWTAEEAAELPCRLYPADYTLAVNFGGRIPLDLLHDGCLKIAVSLNGAKIGEISVTEENNGGSAELIIPETLVTDGENLLTFESELWRASEITEGDSRMLGFPLESVVFSPIV